MSTASDPGQWQGMWIWSHGGLACEHRNEYCHLRKTFQLTSPPVAAMVRLTADNRYQLFVNGKFVCRGPARCQPKFQAYDEIDLAPFLKKGKNCIAVLACHYGETTFQSIERGGWGFLLDGEVTCRSGKPEPLHTGYGWKAHRGEAYNRQTERYTVQLGFQEDFDANKALTGWTRTSYNDRDWSDAWIYGRPTTMPFESFEPRGIPFETESPARFADITGSFTGSNGKGYKDARNIAELLASETHRPAVKPTIRNVQAGLRKGTGQATIQPTSGNRFHAIVLDAGKETAGFVHLDIDAAGGEIVDLFYCEHVRPDGTAIVRAQNGALACMADRYRCAKGRQQHTFFAWKGFRYVLMVFRDVKKPLKLHHVGYTFTSYPVERRGSFHCSDSLLNRIWEVGAYTLQLCMHDAYMDCPWREQAQWWGDARIQWRVNMAAFGDHALFKRGLRQAAQSQAVHGLTYGLFPCEAHHCILPDYTLVWICSLWDYYWYTNDAEPIREHYDAVLRALAWFERNAGKDHLLHHPGYGLWLFLDWAPLYKADCNATFTLQYLEALQLAQKMASLLKRTGDARKFGQLAANVERAVVQAFWDAKGKQFYEGYDRRKKSPYKKVAQHGNTYAILTGTQRKWHANIGERLAWIYRNHDRLAEANTGGNSHHPGADYPIASTFFYAYVLDAMFKANQPDVAMDAIRTLWKMMLDDGATTWYETWNHNPETYGNSSACHAWSASPTYHLSEQIGGVTPTAPGFREVRIAPRFFDLDHAHVVTPTPLGNIDVQWERTGDGVDLRVQLPKGIRGTVRAEGNRARAIKSGNNRIRLQK